jgi:hypothetical protein
LVSGPLSARFLAVVSQLFEVPGVPFPLSPSPAGLWQVDEAAGTVTVAALAHSDIFIDPGDGFANGSDDHTSGDKIGFEGQSPTGDGCAVTFDEIRFRPERLADLRDGS